MPGRRRPGWLAALAVVVWLGGAFLQAGAVGARTTAAGRLGLWPDLKTLLPQPVTFPLTADQVAQDAVTPLENLQYSHGGFMAYAPAMLADDTWVQILKALSPNVYQDLVDLKLDAKKTFVDTLIKSFENNPIVNAYGHLQHVNEKHTPLIMEWDCFLPPASTPANPMVDQILVAHGRGLSDLRNEAGGKNAYNDVAKVSPIKFGGVTLNDWKNKWTAALKMARAAPDQRASVGRTFSWQDFVQEYRVGLTDPNTVVRVVLDMKTGYEGEEKAGRGTPAVIRAVIAQLRTWGITVEAVGSFNWNQISFLTSDQESKAKPIMFFHSVKSNWAASQLYAPQLFDLYDQKQGPFDPKSRPKGTNAEINVMFNAGFLVSFLFADYIAHGKYTYGVREHYLTRLAQIQSDLSKDGVQLHVGLYVQEYDIKSEIVGKLFSLYNTHKSLFSMGFAWGGRQDKFYKNVGDTSTTARVGLAAQVAFGELESFHRLGDALKGAGSTLSKWWVKVKSGASRAWNAVTNTASSLVSRVMKEVNTVVFSVSEHVQEAAQVALAGEENNRRLPEKLESSDNIRG